MQWLTLFGMKPRRCNNMITDILKKLESHSVFFGDDLVYVTSAADAREGLLASHPP